MPTIRQAELSDVPQIVELAVVMHDELDGPHPRGEWARAFEGELIDRMRNDTAFVAFVVEVDDAGVVAYAAGEVRRRFPGPGSQAPVFGYGMIGSTAPGHRKRGYMTACWKALFDYFVEHGCERLSVFSSQQAEGMHLALGFERHDGWPVPMNRHAHKDGSS